MVKTVGNFFSMHFKVHQGTRVDGRDVVWALSVFTGRPDKYKSISTLLPRCFFLVLWRCSGSCISSITLLHHSDTFTPIILINGVMIIN
jgi:hypothetical protein